MPAHRLFALGVGHVRRRGIEPGGRADAPAEVIVPGVVELNALEWRVLTALKRELAPAEIVRDVWRGRAAEAGVSLEKFARVGKELNARGVIGRFSTFLEHVKPNANAGGQSVTRYNALFHWAVPVGRELEAGREVGRHYIMTHAYWREGGPEFRNVNIMGVAHGTEKENVLAHKAAIDEHLREAGIGFDYTNVFWGGRSEIKPSEISPAAYADVLRRARARPGGDALMRLRLLATGALCALALSACTKAGDTGAARGAGRPAGPHPDRLGHLDRGRPQEPQPRLRLGVARCSSSRRSCSPTPCSTTTTPSPFPTPSPRFPRRERRRLQRRPHAQVQAAPRHQVAGRPGRAAPAATCASPGKSW